jgi:hypothetical protein
MIVEITIKDDYGNVVAHSNGLAEQPLEWKAPNGYPLLIERSGKDSGAYFLYSFVYTPRTMLNLQWRKPLNG